MGLKHNYTRVRYFETINDLEIVYGDVIFGKEYEYIKLVGDWQLLGIYPELTEEQAKMVVEANEIDEYKSYKEHFTNPYFFGYKTALESFQSLMERENITGYDKYAILIKSK